MHQSAQQNNRGPQHPLLSSGQLSQRSQILESPALSYHLSHTRLCAKLLSGPSDISRVDLRPVLQMPQVQKILQQETVLATIHGAGSEQVAQLR